MSGELDGTWTVRMTRGVLKAMPPLTKRVEGGRGWTQFGPLRVPFSVEGRRLRYRWPLRGLVDELEPEPSGFEGRATVAGHEYGRFRLYRPDDREEAEMAMQSADQLVRYLDEALAMEQSVVRMLDSVIFSFDDDDVKEALRRHKLETERHIDRVRLRMEAHGQTPSLVREAGGIVGAMMKSVIDLTRSQKAARGIRDAYATEHLEIAAYQLLERAAVRAGDEETAEVARENRLDEERMAAWIDDHWDLFTELAVAEARLRA